MEAVNLEIVVTARDEASGVLDDVGQAAERWGAAGYGEEPGRDFDDLAREMRTQGIGISSG